MLTPRKHLKKRELKEDKLVTIYSNARRWAEQNFRILAGASVGIVVVIIALVFVSDRREEKQAEASVLFVQAKQQYNQRNYTRALQQFSALVESYGGTMSGKISRLYQGKCFYEKEDYENAYKQFKAFSGSIKGSDHFQMSGLINAAACLEQQEKYEQAARELENAAKKYPKSAHAPFALLKAGQNYDELENYEQAGQLYEKIVQKYPESAEKNDAILLNSMN
ncbi:MAG: tetratricopeptide repeat protein [candidate division KSB1 bacterium]|nr:tetratricopeptide repeat protein [candidate division KSB1 bacterium]